MRREHTPDRWVFAAALLLAVTLTTSHACRSRSNPRRFAAAITGVRPPNTRALRG